MIRDQRESSAGRRKEGTGVNDVEEEEEGEGEEVSRVSVVELGLEEGTAGRCSPSLSRAPLDSVSVPTFFSI